MFWRNSVAVRGLDEFARYFAGSKNKALLIKELVTNFVKEHSW